MTIKKELFDFLDNIKRDGKGKIPINNRVSVVTPKFGSVSKQRHSRFETLLDMMPKGIKVTELPSIDEVTFERKYETLKDIDLAEFRSIFYSQNITKGINSLYKYHKCDNMQDVSDILNLSMKEKLQLRGIGIKLLKDIAYLLDKYENEALLIEVDKSNFVDKITLELDELNKPKQSFDSFVFAREFNSLSDIDVYDEYCKKYKNHRHFPLIDGYPADAIRKFKWQGYTNAQDIKDLLESGVDVMKLEGIGKRSIEQMTLLIKKYESEAIIQEGK